MGHREYTAVILQILAVVLFISGAAALSMLPRVANIFAGMGLFAAAMVLGFVSLEFLPPREEDP